MKKWSVVALILLVASTFVYAEFAKTNVNLFVAYFSPNNMQALADYVYNQQLAGSIMWEMKGDKSFDSGSSLLAALKGEYQGKLKPATVPQSMVYWTNWGIYAADSYPIDNSYDDQGKKITNPEFVKTLAGANIIAYAFFETQNSSDNSGAQNIGKLYFTDPWADLNIAANHAGQTELCKNQADICWYKSAGRTPQAAGRGNMVAFSKLQVTDPYYGVLRKVISVGGANHDATFTDVFANPAYVANFVSSAKAIITAFNLDGIDLDYESFTMTPAMSKQYANLVAQLRAALPGKQITVTILSDPAFIQGIRDGQYGYDAGALRTIASNANYINLMTYDFHGAWDQLSGFLTNIHVVDSDPFSVESSVTALFNAGVPYKQIMVGAPAYGRAVTVSGAGADGTGFHQTVTGTIMGDTGESSMFQYKYIVDKMPSLTAVIWDGTSGHPNYGATSAYGVLAVSLKHSL